MPDGIPSIVSRLPVAVMKHPIKFMEVCIDDKVQGSESKVFYLNDCTVNIVSFEVEDTRCAGRSCDTQRGLEVRKCSQGCACYSFDSRRTNMVVDHAMNLKHIYLMALIILIITVL